MENQEQDRPRNYRFEYRVMVTDVDTGEVTYAGTRNVKDAKDTGWWYAMTEWEQVWKELQNFMVRVEAAPVDIENERRAS